jgi:CDP-diacylglycerol--serine O-phosphatidyltransferase
MRRLRSEPGRDSLLRRVRRQQVKYITILPSLVTILNGVCGFASIVFASKGAKAGMADFSYFAIAGYMILLAMIADMLDGRLARFSHSTSSFGGQLDSLCDAISFGLAPAFLMLKILDHKLTAIGFGNDVFMQRFIWLAGAAYMSCAAIRLARFNVENDQDESAHMNFVGLPSPAAAGVIVSLVIFHQETLPQADIVIYVLPFVALAIAILMVSRIRYPHLLNQYLHGKKPFAYLLRALLLLGLIVVSWQSALVLVFCGFAASSFLKWFYNRVLRRRQPLAEQASIYEPQQ